MDLKERLLVHLKEIARDRDPYFAPLGHFYVQEYIRKQLQQWGEIETDEFLVNGKIYQNLVLNLPCLTKAEKATDLPPILICAHYDTVPGTPGADDNATGVAALLEIAREFASAPPRYPIRLIAFDLEEYGLLGSEHYAAKLQEQKQQLRLAIALEMLGYCSDRPDSQSYPAGLKSFYSNRGNFIALIGNLSSMHDLIYLGDCLRKNGIPCEWLPVPNRGLIVPDTRRSDHAAFWDRNYRGIMVTDTANMRNPNYHQKSDTIETLDLDFFAGVCRGLIAGIRSL